MPVVGFVDGRYEIRKSTRAHKKYMIRVGARWVHFGDTRYQQYRDSSPLKLYKRKDHGDKERRRRYFARHGRTADKGSAKYWSNRLLW